MDFKEVHGWVLCSHKNHFYISLRNQGPRVQCEVSTVSAGLGSSIICCCWRLLSRSMQTSTEICRPLCASFWPALWRCWFYFPAELAHTDNDTNTWFMDHGIPVQNWWAKLPGQWGIVKSRTWDTRSKNAEELKAWITAVVIHVKRAPPSMLCTYSFFFSVVQHFFHFFFFVLKKF